MHIVLYHLTTYVPATIIKIQNYSTTTEIPLVLSNYRYTYPPTPYTPQYISSRPSPHHPCDWQPLICFPSVRFTECYTNIFIKYVTFRDWHFFAQHDNHLSCWVYIIYLFYKLLNSFWWFNTIYLILLLLKDILIVSVFLLLKIKPLGTILYRFLCAHVFISLE